MDTTQRQLGYWESLHALIHDSAHGHGIITLVAQISGKLNTQRLQRALALVFNRHPLLQSSINTAPDNPDNFVFQRCVEFADIPFNIIAKQHDDHWQEIFEAELSTPLQCQHHLWRCQIVLAAEPFAHSEVIVSFHHAICDGISAGSFFHDLLQCYVGLAKNDGFCLPALSLQPAIEKLLQKPAHTDQAFIQNQLNPKLPPTPWPYLQNAPLGERRTKISCRTIAPNEYTLLERSCHKQKVSVHAAINAATIIAAQKKQSQPINITIQTPVNMRLYCRPVVSAKHIGCYASIATTHYYDIDADQDFWELARDYRQQLKLQLPKVSLNPVNYQRDSLKKLIDLFCVTPRDQFTLGFGITHSGKIALNNVYDEHEINFIYGCPSRQAADFVVLLCVAVLNDTVYFTFSYSYPMLSPEWVEAFADDVMASLDSCAPPV